MKKILLYLLALCATASATTLETQATDQMTWKPTAYNFQVPAYFSDGTEYFYGDGPYSMVIYKHQDAQLSYCSLLGNWACDDEAFPVPGSVLAQNATIKNIVYHAKNGVFSGYTTDGRIFYMKKKSQPNAVAPEEGFSICHSSFLAIIYPKSRQKEMDPVIQMINKIKSFEGSSQSSTPLTYKSVAGIYDSYDEDGGNQERISLNADGTATWNMVGSLHFTEFTYTIKGNTIRVKEVDGSTINYTYDHKARTLKSPNGTIYHWQE